MIAPKAIRVPTSPIVEPIPLVKAVKVSASGMPATTARTAEPSVSARKGCILRQTMSTMIDQVLMILYALLALSIIIAIFGIVNTLALSVSERTKEIGLLRAIGTSRGQVRGMLGIEAAIISVFGTVMGLVVGVSAGVVIRAVYASKGLETLAVPWTQLLIFLVLSIVVGLISSISPASRALRQPVLDAVASE